MEQSINNFTKGLQMDPHPMVQGNDVLSDALNATFITGNGNELVLQNDMGNRRVDEAFLPPGYVPLGIKEYGGIIYVAAYNPITNRGQVGSFPSPERKIIDEQPDLNIDFSFQTFQERGFQFFVEQDKIWILYDKNTFHIGDKFTLYNNRIWEKINGRIFGEMYLSNFCNTTESKVVSPKNKFYTLSLGILDQNNQFVDITKSLKRFNGSKYLESPSLGIQLFENSSNELYNFNQGYFIAPVALNEGGQENEVDKVREMGGHNLYGFKLISPLCLKLHFNRAQSFSYSFSGTKDDNNCTLNIRGTLYYNCPDGAVSEGQCNDINYYKYYTQSVPQEWFNLYLVNKGNNNYIKQFQSEGNYNDKVDSVNIVYLKDQNLYKATINKKYTFQLENYSDNDVVKYFIGVPFNLTEDTTIEDPYLRGCSYFGELDLNSLNPVYFEVYKWQFKTENNQTTVNYEFRFDIQYNYNITLEFVSVDEDKSFTIGDISEQTGEFVIEGDNYIDRGAYKATIKYSNENYYGEIPGYWVLCTSLFNDSTINNYVYPKTEQEIEEWNELVTIPLQVNYMQDSIGSSKSRCINNSSTPMSTLSNLQTGYIRKSFVSEFDEILEVRDISVYDWNKYPLYIEKALKNTNNISDIEVETIEDATLNTNYRTVSIITEEGDYYGTLSDQEYSSESVNYTNIKVQNNKEKLSIQGGVTYEWDFNYNYTAIPFVNNKITIFTIFSDNPFSSINTPDFYMYYTNDGCYFRTYDDPTNIMKMYNLNIDEQFDPKLIHLNNEDGPTLESKLDQLAENTGRFFLVCDISYDGSIGYSYQYGGFTDTSLEKLSNSPLIIFAKSRNNSIENEYKYKIIAPASENVLGNNLNTHIYTTLNEELINAGSNWRVESESDIYVPSSVIKSEDIQGDAFQYVICNKNEQVQNPRGTYNYGVIVSISNLNNSFKVKNIKVKDGIDSLNIFNYSASLGNITDSSGNNTDLLQLDIYPDSSEIIKLSGYDINITNPEENFEIYEKEKYIIHGETSNFETEDITEDTIYKHTKYDTKYGYSVNIFAKFTDGRNTKIFPVGGIFDYNEGELISDTEGIRLIPYPTYNNSGGVYDYYFDKGFILALKNDSSGSIWMKSSNINQRNIINRFATITRRGDSGTQEDSKPQLIFALQ